jgi:hypothetical protein
MNHPHSPTASERQPAKPPLTTEGLQATFEALAALSSLFSAMHADPAQP